MFRRRFFPSLRIVSSVVEMVEVGGLLERPLGFGRACAGTTSPGTSINGRASHVHDGLGRRLASASLRSQSASSRPVEPVPSARPAELAPGGGGGDQMVGLRARVRQYCVSAVFKR